MAMGGDPRVAKLARVLVRYSIGVKAGDLFQINAPALAAPLIRELRERMFARSASGELNWAITLFPTQAAAQDAEMSLADYEDFVYAAGKLDRDDPVAAWQAVHVAQQRIA